MAKRFPKDPMDLLASPIAQLVEKATELELLILHTESLLELLPVLEKLIVTLQEALQRSKQAGAEQAAAETDRLPADTSPSSDQVADGAKSPPSQNIVLSPSLPHHNKREETAIPSGPRERLAQWFKAQRIELEEANTALPEPLLLSISNRLGKFYSYFQSFLDDIKRQLSKNNLHPDISFYHTVGDKESNKKLSLLYQLCYDLHKAGLLSNFHGRRTAPRNASLYTYTFLLKIANNNAARSFLNGEWLELFIINTILEATKSLDPASFVWARNLKIRFADSFRQSQQRREIDCFLLINNIAFCFEAKSGGIEERDLAKYRDLCLRLNIPASRSFVVTANFSTSEAIAHKYGVTICAAAEFPGCLQSEIEKL